MKREYKSVPPMCKNCLYAGYTINKNNPRKFKREYFCGNLDGSHFGIPVYFWEWCGEYKKRYHRNRQLDIIDIQEAAEIDRDTSD